MDGRRRDWCYIPASLKSFHNNENLCATLQSCARASSSLTASRAASTTWMVGARSWEVGWAATLLSAFTASQDWLKDIGWCAVVCKTASKTCHSCKENGWTVGHSLDGCWCCAFEVWELQSWHVSCISIGISLKLETMSGFRL